MNQDSTKQIIDALRPVADKIGQGASHLYEIYVRQAYIGGFARLAWAVPFFIVVAVAAYITVKDIKSEYGEPGGPLFIGAVALLIGVGLTVAGVMHLINPEYYAIHNIICQAKGGCS